MYEYTFTILNVAGKLGTLRGQIDGNALTEQTKVCWFESKLRPKHKSLITKVAMYLTLNTHHIISQRTDLALFAVMPFLPWTDNSFILFDFYPAIPLPALGHHLGW